MAGLSEILVLILLIAGILILPRFFKSQPGTQEPALALGDRFKNLSVKIRAAISLTIVYPVASCLYFRPWEDRLVLYLLVGVLPMIIFWSVIWILSGPKNK